MRSRQQVPSYRSHKRTGRAIVTVRDHEGKRRDILLPGAFESQESRAAYVATLVILKKNDGSLPPPPVPSPAKVPEPTIAEIMVQYVELHVDRNYASDEAKNIRYALRPLNRLYADLPAKDFDPICLLTLRDAITSGSWLSRQEKAKFTKGKRPIGQARTTANRNVGRVKAMFAWAACHMKEFPPSVYHSLTAVKGLRIGHPGVRETDPVAAVNPVIVEQVIPALPPVVADMVRLLLLTGARVGELCRLRTVDIDRSGPVWCYQVVQHKNRHRGHTRTVTFGPKAQLILRRYIKTDQTAALFSPSEQDRLIREKKRAERQCPNRPSKLTRAKKRRRSPGELFDHHAIDHAIARACRRLSLPHFHVNQLRHTAALTIMREHGIEAARSTLGHKKLNMTLFYAGIDLEKSKEVASKIG